jgi:hypothetical protein
MYIKKVLLAVLLSLFLVPTSVKATALFFDGIDDYVVVPDSASLDITQSLTMELWLKFSNYPNCCFNVPIGKAFSHPTTNNSYVLGFSNHEGSTSEDTLLASFGTTGTSGDTSLTVSATPIRNDQWHHVASVYDFGASEIRLYVDGFLVSLGVATGLIRETDFDLVIGSQLGFDRRTFEGFIDEVRLWNVARTQTEIQENMMNELTGSENGLAAYWQFNEGQGSIANDSSQNNNQGTLFGNPTWVASADLALMQVPEPTTLAILGLGLVGLGALRRTRAV